MMRCLREVNADNNTVGWYQSTSLGAFQTAELADTFAAYASTIRRAVCIVVDPDAARGGGAKCFLFLFRVSREKEGDEINRGVKERKPTHSKVVPFFSLQFFFRPTKQAAASPA